MHNDISVYMMSVNVYLFFVSDFMRPFAFNYVSIRHNHCHLKYNRNHKFFKV